MVPGGSCLENSLSHGLLAIFVLKMVDLEGIQKY